MKKTILALTLFGLTCITNAQEASVEKSTNGVQIGVLGIWAYNESKLSNQIALRSEIGFDGGVYGSDSNDINGLFLTPTITVEPRWYYNLNKRKNKSKRIAGNSGNFVSLKTSYHPDWFLISNEPNINFVSDITIIPTWGIRRYLGNHFNYEAGIGVGYIHYFKKGTDAVLFESDVAINLHLRIGYSF